jgi:glucokinase
MKQIIGIDFGGTNIKLGLVTPEGAIVDRDRLETQTCHSSHQALIKQLIGKVKDLLARNALTARRVGGIGIGLPGLIDPSQGVVRFLPNVPGWNNVPLVRILEKALGIWTMIDNDVNLIALAEWKYGAARGYDQVVCLTLGTGVGAGLILDAKLYRGQGFVAGEVGHMPLNEKGPACSCGGKACLERYIGNQELLQKAKKVFKDKKITLEAVYQLARSSDPRALAFWEETATHLGNGLIGVVNLLNPQVIVIGGGVAKSFRFLKKPLTRVIKTHAMDVQAKMVKIVRARLGDDAGILGAQILIKDEV